jgi:hypothetical protein
MAGRRSAPDSPDYLSLRFHSYCYAIWQQECVHRVADAKRIIARDDQGLLVSD